MTPRARNLLIIMCDRLRADHLSCYGHPRLATPNLDALAARGVQFDDAFVQSGMCGPSRMSFDTGRYVSSHGATSAAIPRWKSRADAQAAARRVHGAETAHDRAVGRGRAGHRRVPACRRVLRPVMRFRR